MRSCLAILLLLGLTACGGEEPATLTLKVNSASSVDSDDLREFNDVNPPEKVLVLVARSSDVTGSPMADVSERWIELARDSNSGRPYLLVDVPPNAGQADPYILRLASVVTEGDTEVVHECGVIGNIVADRGAKLRLEITTHDGNCNWICASDEDCVGDRYCQSFECQNGIYCLSDLDCPAGGHCSEDNQCSARCGDALPDCPLGFVCCQYICSQSCAAG